MEEGPIEGHARLLSRFMDVRHALGIFGDPLTSTSLDHVINLGPPAVNRREVDRGEVVSFSNILGAPRSCDRTT